MNHRVCLFSFLGDRDLANYHLNAVKFPVFYLTLFGWAFLRKEFPWLGEHH